MIFFDFTRSLDILLAFSGILTLAKFKISAGRNQYSSSAPGRSISVLALLANPGLDTILYRSFPYHDKMYL